MIPHNRGRGQWADAIQKYGVGYSYSTYFDHWTSGDGGEYGR